MPKYTVITKQTIEREYDHDLDLPIHMGESNDRLCDRMIRTAAENGALSSAISMTEVVHLHGGPDEGPEEILAIYRDGKQIWPAHRKRVKNTIDKTKFSTPPLLLDDVPTPES